MGKGYAEMLHSGFCLLTVEFREVNLGKFTKLREEDEEFAFIFCLVMSFMY